MTDQPEPDSLTPLRQAQDERGPRPTRAIARQATSRVAFVAEPPDEDDPLLAFAPAPHVAARRNPITADRQRAFVAHLAATGIVAQAARHIGASLEALYRLRRKPGAEAFAAAWDAAAERGIDLIEDGALARAIHGEVRHVVSGGKVVVLETRHNEALVQFFLRNRRRSTYGKETLIGPGHPVYAHIEQEVEARLGAAYEERRKSLEKDFAKAAKELDARRDALFDEVHELETELERERAELADLAEGRLPLEEGARGHLFFLLAQLSLEDLRDCVDWPAVKKARKAA
ncbi:hypothetical protein [Tsuneonella sp. HG222]